MRIHVLYTGGTIGMIPSDHGLVPGADLAGWLQRLQREHATALPALELRLHELTPLIDSSNATPANWEQILTAIEQAAQASASERPEAYLILHGTDTMAYTAAALSYALAAPGTPVILTGSQLPLGHEGSDAAANVLLALRAAAHLAGYSGNSWQTPPLTPAPQGTRVWLAFGGRILPGNRATKCSSWAMEGFEAPNPLPEPAAHPALNPAPALGELDRPSGAAASAIRAKRKPYRGFDVPLIDVVPGMPAQRLAAMLDPLPDAVILRAFGVGNLPAATPGFTAALERVLAAGVPVIIASQCHQARVLLGHYEAGDAAARAGAVGSGDMTLEATYAKVIYLLSQGLRGQDLAAAMSQPIAGETSEAGE